MQTNSRPATIADASDRPTTESGEPRKQIEEDDARMRVLWASIRLHAINKVIGVAYARIAK